MHTYIIVYKKNDNIHVYNAERIIFLLRLARKFSFASLSSQQIFHNWKVFLHFRVCLCWCMEYSKSLWWMRAYIVCGCMLMCMCASLAVCACVHAYAYNIYNIHVEEERKAYAITLHYYLYLYTITAGKNHSCTRKKKKFRQSLDRMHRNCPILLGRHAIYPPYSYSMY